MQRLEIRPLQPEREHLWRTTHPLRRARSRALLGAIVVLDFRLRRLAAHVVRQRAASFVNTARRLGGSALGDLPRGRGGGAARAKAQFERRGRLGVGGGRGGELARWREHGLQSTACGVEICDGWVGGGGGLW